MVEEPKPKREIGSAAIVPDPKTEIPVYKPPSASAVIKAIESAPARVKKIFGLTNYGWEFGPPEIIRLIRDTEEWFTRPRWLTDSLTDVANSSRSISLISDNSACCVCARTAEWERAKQTIKCSQCEVIVHPAATESLVKSGRIGSAGCVQTSLLRVAPFRKQRKI